LLAVVGPDVGSARSTLAAIAALHASILFETAARAARFSPAAPAAR
jgi:hypothetical protein